MKVKVTAKGVVIPRTWLKGVEEVEIKKENGLILIIPVTDVDPITKLGQDPVVCGVSDGSENHDRYLRVNHPYSPGI